MIATSDMIGRSRAAHDIFSTDAKWSTDVHCTELMFNCNTLPNKKHLGLVLSVSYNILGFIDRWYFWMITLPLFNLPMQGENM